MSIDKWIVANSGNNRYRTIKPEDIISQLEITPPMVLFNNIFNIENDNEWMQCFFNSNSFITHKASLISGSTKNTFIEMQKQFEINNPNLETLPKSFSIGNETIGSVEYGITLSNNGNNLTYTPINHTDGSIPSFEISISPYSIEYPDGSKQIDINTRIFKEVTTEEGYLLSSSRSFSPQLELIRENKIVGIPNRLVGFRDEYFEGCELTIVEQIKKFDNPNKSQPSIEINVYNDRGNGGYVGPLAKYLVIGETDTSYQVIRTGLSFDGTYLNPNIPDSVLNLANQLAFRFGQKLSKKQFEDLTYKSPNGENSDLGFPIYRNPEIPEEKKGGKYYDIPLENISELLDITSRIDAATKEAVGDNKQLSYSLNLKEPIKISTDEGLVEIDSIEINIEDDTFMASDNGEETLKNIIKPGRKYKIYGTRRVGQTKRFPISLEIISDQNQGRSSLPVSGINQVCNLIKEAKEFKVIVALSDGEMIPQPEVGSNTPEAFLYIFDTIQELYNIEDPSKLSQELKSRLEKELEKLEGKPSIEIFFNYINFINQPRTKELSINLN